MTDTPHTPPAPAAAEPAPSLSPSGLAKWVAWLVGKIVAAFLYLFKAESIHVKAIKWTGGWTLTLTGLSSLWKGAVVLARNPTAAILAGVIALGGYWLGHHEANNAWAPTARELKSVALTNIKLAQENDALKARPTPACTPGAPAPADATPPAAAEHAAIKPPRRRPAARSWWQ